MDGVGPNACVAQHMQIGSNCLKSEQLLLCVFGSLLDKLPSHSEDGFVLFIKNYMMKFYSITCTIINLYICRQNNKYLIVYE